MSLQIVDHYNEKIWLLYKFKINCIKKKKQCTNVLIKSDWIGLIYWVESGSVTVPDYRTIKTF
jgi:hypothetical protein